VAASILAPSAAATLAREAFLAPPWIALPRNSIFPVVISARL
jgi:hypothetical protein